jgi:hypothetical protein
MGFLRLRLLVSSNIDFVFRFTSSIQSVPEEIIVSTRSCSFRGVSVSHLPLVTISAMFPVPSNFSVFFGSSPRCSNATIEASAMAFKSLRLLGSLLFSICSSDHSAVYLPSNSAVVSVRVSVMAMVLLDIPIRVAGLSILSSLGKSWLCCETCGRQMDDDATDVFLRDSAVVFRMVGTRAGRICRISNHRRMVRTGFYVSHVSARVILFFASCFITFLTRPLLFQRWTLCRSFTCRH